MRQLITRIDDDLHRRLKARAAREGRSVNALVTEILDASVQPDDEIERLREHARSLGLLLEPREGAGAPPDRDELARLTEGFGDSLSRIVDEGRGEAVTAVFADTSVLLRARMADEPGHESAARLTAGRAVVASELAVVELLRAVRLRTTSEPGVGDRIVSAFRDARELVLVPLSLDALGEHLDLVFEQTRLRTLDAIHVAQALACMPALVGRDWTFMTCDLAQAEGARAMGARVVVA